MPKSWREFKKTFKHSRTTRSRCSRGRTRSAGGKRRGSAGISARVFSIIDLCRLHSRIDQMPERLIVSGMITAWNSNAHCNFFNCGRRTEPTTQYRFNEICRASETPMELLNYIEALLIKKLRCFYRPECHMYQISLKVSTITWQWNHTIGDNAITSNAVHLYFVFFIPRLGKAKSTNIGAMRVYQM